MSMDGAGAARQLQLKLKAKEKDYKKKKKIQSEPAGSCFSALTLYLPYLGQKRGRAAELEDLQ